MAPTNFLSLPAELRNQIYTLVFSALFMPLENPWDDGKVCTTILSLLLANRQVYNEVSSFLRHGPVDRLRLHFDNGKCFENFLESTLPCHPQLESARFRLRVTVRNKRALNLAIHEDGFRTIKQLLCPENRLVRYDASRRSGTIEEFEATLSQHWARLHESFFYPKHPVRDAVDRAGGRRCARYWIHDSLFTYHGFKWATYAWDAWLIRDDEGKTLRGKEAGFDVALGRKVRSECVVIEGRVADAVKAMM